MLSPRAPFQRGLIKNPNTKLVHLTAVLVLTYSSDTIHHTIKVNMKLQLNRLS